MHARLRATLDDGSRVTLQEGMLPVSAGYRRTRTFIDAMLAIWPARAAADIATGGWSDLPRSAAADQRRVDGLNQGDRSIQERIGWMIASPWVRLARWWRDTARYDTWNVGLASLPDRLTDPAQLRAIGGLHWLPPRPPAGTFLRIRFRAASTDARRCWSRTTATRKASADASRESSWTRRR